MSVLIGVDIGATTVKLGVILHGEHFQVLRQTAIDTRPHDPAGLFAGRVAGAIQDLIVLSGHPPVEGIGIGCPGLIDPLQGIIRTAANLKNLAGFPLKERLATLTGLPVEIQNDASAAVLGEWIFSPASKGLRNLILITLGTGVGGGVICDGHLLTGAANAAAELGHLKVEYHNPAPCTCGKRGCLEAYAGLAGIRRIAHDLIAKGIPTALRVGDTITTEQIAAAARHGDPVGQQTLLAAGQYIGRAIAICIETFNPQKLILGGGASAAIDQFMPGINAALDQWSSLSFTRQMCQIERSAFPDNINIVGAAATWLYARRPANV